MSILPTSNINAEETHSKLLGPFGFLVKITLLDCSSNSKCIRFISTIIAVIITVLLFVRVGLLMETKGNSLSFAWSESNFFGFPAIFAPIVAICLCSWSRKGFSLKYSKKLTKVRMLRLELNESLNEYRLPQIVALLFSIPWLVAMMSWIVFNFTAGKVLYGGDESNIIIRVIFVVSNFYIWLITTIILAQYSLIMASLNREVNYFNEELQKAKNEKILKNLGVLEKFDFRQNEILDLILYANDHLSSFGGIAPLFLFYGLVNGAYLTGFMDLVPLLYFVILCFNLAAIIIYNLLILSPACALQENLASTSRILINNDEFESTKDPIVYQTYRIMCDRIQKVDTRMYVIAAIPVIKKSLAVALFIVPNLGMLLLMVKKVLIANGGHV